MDCEVCGSSIHGRGITLRIDGAELVACPMCASRATSSKMEDRSTTPVLFASLARKTTQPQSSRTRALPAFQPRRRSAPPVVRSEDFELVDNCGQAIRRAREAQHLSQEDLCRRIAEKVSVLQNVEAGRLVPPDTVARKLEHALKIRLLQPVTKTPPAEDKFSHPLELTLGDVAVMMKRHGQRQETEEKQNNKKRM